MVTLALGRCDFYSLLCGKSCEDILPSRQTSKYAWEKDSEPCQEDRDDGGTTCHVIVVWTGHVGVVYWAAFQVFPRFVLSWFCATSAFLRNPVFVSGFSHLASSFQILRSWWCLTKFYLIRQDPRSSDWSYPHIKHPLEPLIILACFTGICAFNHELPKFSLMRLPLHSP